MVAVKITNIITDVKLALDENESASNVLLADTDQLQMDALIRSKIIDAVRYIHQAAPISMVDGQTAVGKPGYSAAWATESGISTITLPTDFLRLVIFKMTNWTRPITNPILDTDPEYAMQRSKYKGIKGGKEKPVAAITTNGSGSKVLEGFTSETADVEKIVYIPIPSISGTSPNETVNICAQLYQPVIYHCAGLVAMTYKDELAKDLFEIAKSYIS